ncbi:LemA family protein [Candidatus Saccharibacteria bacterium]|nr:LemA family protein [Candidatus Saccharibacteria bacterium]MBI2285566.1 LemA family protein [Candidatus Saccharibacteria bacterium]
MTWIIIGIIVALLLLIIYIYNSLVRAKVRVDEAWSDITVQLKRRYDLIPNLVETVKGYAKHEKKVFTDVTKARTEAMKAQTVGEAAQADNMFQAALKSLFAVAEAYPQLRATENFQQLQSDVTDTEDKIQAARRFYNGAVRDLNIRIQTFPNNLFATMLGFKLREFFDVDENQRQEVGEPVKVDFSKE